MSFEETYQRHSFSELVRLGIVTAKFVRGLLDRRQAAEANTRVYDSEATPTSHTQTAFGR